MFERYLADFIATQFGHIIANHEILSVSAWNGGIVLNDVELRKDALDHFKLSMFEIAFGKIGKLEVNIPWSILKSQLLLSSSTSTVTVVLTDVNVLLTPRRSSREQKVELSDAELDRIREQTVQAFLDGEILQRLSVQRSLPAARKSGWRWRLQERVKDVLSNLSVRVENIHIRYEDPGTCFGFQWTETAKVYRPPFATGVTLKQFSIESTSREEFLQYKEASADSVAIYWDSDVQLMAGLDDPDYTASFALLAERRLSKSGYQSGHVFLLDPFSPLIKFGLSSRSANVSNTVDVRLPPCRITISRSLLEDAGYLRKSLAMWRQAQEGLLLPEETLHRLTSLRPNVSATLDPRAWWKYALTAVSIIVDDRHLEEKRRSKGWLGLADALRRRQQYVQLFERFLLTSDKERETINHNLLVFERELLVSEVVAFRIAIFDHVWRRKDEDSNDGRALSRVLEPVESGVSAGPVASPRQTKGEQNALSCEYRSQMFLGLAMGLYRELQQKEANGMPVAAAPTDDTLVAWRTNLSCSEVSLQVNDHRRTPVSSGWGYASPRTLVLVPIVRLSCCIVQEQELCRDGSWEMTNRIGSLVVEDSTSIASSRVGEARAFPNLLGPKIGDPSINNDDAMFSFGGKSYRQSVLLRIRRSKKWAAGRTIGSTTTTEVRVLPMEIVYSAVPVEALSHAFDPINDLESNDYQRIAVTMSAWRKKQQKRLLQALAHREKKVHVSVVVGSPVILLPEGTRPECSVLVVDLGQLSFADENPAPNEINAFDDVWKLKVKNIQVQSTTIENYRMQESDSPTHSHKGYAQQLVEPFSIHLDMATKVQSDEVENGQTTAQVLATLPRLAFNLTSSTLQLIRRLQRQWEYRKIQRLPLSSSAGLQRLSAHGDLSSDSRASAEAPRRQDRISDRRKLEFHFQAPLFSLRLEDDISSDRLKGDKLAASCPLVDLVLKGIEGSFVCETTIAYAKSTFGAKISALGAVDLYQKAGLDFSLFLASVTPELLNSASLSDFRSFDKPGSASDLVSFRYESKHQRLDPAVPENAESPLENDLCDSDVVSIQFNELYVEWNPETIAAISRALSSEERSLEGQSVESGSATSRDASLDAFFDAEEEAFFDAEYEVSESSSQMLSEIAESERSSYGNLLTITDTPLAVRSHPTQLYSSLGITGSPWIRDRQHIDEAVPSVNVTKTRPLEMVFLLSKLRIHFNKESRCRRLVAAEMAGTSFTYQKQAGGGSKTLARIGNLSLSDCEFDKNKTLYREVLGLQDHNESSSGEATSILEMKLIMKPRRRRYTSLEGKVDDPSLEIGSPVSVDFSSGTVHGFDYYLDAKFSPMRFVYLQQLWFEIVDYFFSGIIASEVWGGVTPLPGDIRVLEGESIAPEDVSFTRFDVSMSSPVIVFPVSPCSTDFARIEASSICLRNRYNHDRLRPATLCFQTDGGKNQWYNNCDVVVNHMTLHSWLGNMINRNENTPTVRLNLAWPVGPSAPVNVPKWKVGCIFDEVSLDLNRSDYALLQNIVSYNIGDPSHHLDEWIALQALSHSSLESYLNSLVIHYGYDKKDATPSTFDVRVDIPSIAFTLKHSYNETSSVVVCSSVCWRYEKLTDRVSKQSVSCDVDIADANETVMLSFASRKRIADSRAVPDLVYTTTTDPVLNNTKVLELSKSNIYFVYKEWMKFSKFFQNLPEPTFLSPEEAIQVGDRWYKISESSGTKEAGISKRHFTWLEPFQRSAMFGEDEVAQMESPTYIFQLFLRDASIRLQSTGDELVLAVHNIKLSHESKSNQIVRRLTLSGFELWRGNVVDPELRHSLVRPWSVEATLNGCNGRIACPCDCHRLRILAGDIHAITSYSDLTTILNCWARVQQDIRLVEEKKLDNLRNLSQSPFHEDGSKIFDAVQGVIPGARRRIFIVEWEGLHLRVLDDSGRHFKGEQDLMVCWMKKAHLNREERSVKGLGDFSWCSMEATCSSVEVFDCLQAEDSPFRHLLRLLPEPNDTGHGLDKSSAVMKSVVGESRIYNVELGVLELQYNPSLIIAVQRFLGRLKKDAFSRHSDILAKDWRVTDALIDTPASMHQLSSRVIVTFSSELISVCLNKEHQGRRLLGANISSTRINFECNPTGSCLSGYIETLAGKRPGDQGIDCVDEVFSCSSQSQRCVQFEYKTFLRRKIENAEKSPAPQWILDELQKHAEIDDYIDLRLGAMQFTYIRDAVEELVDYLGSGMPGKGMGYTSKAAKGFVATRIQKKSFFNIRVESPTLFVPRDVGFDCGVLCHLGSANVRSWIADKDSNEGIGTSRRLSVSSSGVAVGVLRTAPTRIHCSVLSEMDFVVEAELEAMSASLSCKTTDINVALSYSNYTALLDVIQNNVGKSIDKTKWDNLEVAWEQESAETWQHYSAPVTYSESARRVRYGRSKNSSSGSSPKTVSLKIMADRITALLRRDDANQSGVEYDLLICSAEGIEIAVGLKPNDSRCLNFSLHRIFALDLGRAGRLAVGYHNAVYFGSESHDSARVLMDSYTPTDEMTSDLYEASHFDSELVVKIDKAESEVKIIVVVSFLSFTAAALPLREVIQFFSHKWPIASTSSFQISRKDKNDIDNTSCGYTSSKSMGKAKASFSQLSIQFISNYPRLIFPADDADLHSRALLLRGVSIANARVQTSIREMEETDGQDRTTLSVTADFQNVSSYMVPDISELVEIDRERLESLSAFLSPNREFSFSPTTTVAPQLIQLLRPLTFTVEFEQSDRVDDVKERHLAVSVEPLAITLSNEDLLLLRAVSETWSSSQKEAASSPDLFSYSYDAVFHSKRLGLGLRKRSGLIVVDDIASWVSHGNIQIGDAIYAVNGGLLSIADTASLSTVVARLADEERPLTISFKRQIHEQSCGPDWNTDNGTDKIQHTLDKLDLTLAEADIVLVAKDVPIMKGSVNASKIGIAFSRNETTTTKFNVVSSVELAYYNIKLWGWEPFVEPCYLFLSLSFQKDQSNGPSELAVELGDQGEGVNVNLTDALCENISKFLEWIEEEEESDVKELVLSTSHSKDANEGDGQPSNNLASRQAANAAIRFASRQQSDLSKPFLISNKTGVSLAFAQQRNTKEPSRHQSFVGIGDYPGIQDFDSSEVAVLGNNESLNFRADLSEKSELGERNTRDALLDLPSLTLALQEISGVTTEAVHDLPISRPGTTVYPLTFSTKLASSIDRRETRRGWLTWSVEKVDEKTVVTVGSSIRIISFIAKSLEVAVAPIGDDGTVTETGEYRSLGVVRSGERFCLPLWLALKQQSWMCSIRLVGGSNFSPLVSVSSDGNVEIVQLDASCVACRGDLDEKDVKFLAVTGQEDDRIFTVSIEAPLSLRNLLPISLDWEIRNSCRSDRIIDGSTRRMKLLGGTQNLQSGHLAEILAKGLEPIELRVRPGTEFCWSPWLLLDASDVRCTRSKPDGRSASVEETDRPIAVTHVSVADSFGVPCTVTIRVTRKPTGLDMTAHTDVWFTDATSLNLCFGCSINTLKEPIFKQEKRSSESLDFSAAKATLDEISSLFESGDGGLGLRQPNQQMQDSSKEVVRLPGQEIAYITEECFEYLEIEFSTIKRRWWASEDPLQNTESISDIDKKPHDFRWVEKAWSVDASGMTFEGWETSPTLTGYSKRRDFNPTHRYRRRRWRRKRTGVRHGTLVSGVNAFCHLSSPSNPRPRDKGLSEAGIRVALRVDGGKWSVTSMLPKQGTGFGVVRLSSARWPDVVNERPSHPEARVFELCYSIFPLEGDWGLFTRSLLITARFLLRNDSASTTFEVKQTGVNDSLSVLVPPGATTPFHWSDSRMPELISVRPYHQEHRGCIYAWSGGFDPLTICSIPLRIRRTPVVRTDHTLPTELSHAEVCAIRADVEIRTRTGGTGINISFQEEDRRGIGAMFRIENMSPFPLWICQDGILSNPSLEVNEELGDIISPYEELAFSLDVPFRQGKYAHRRAEPMSVLLRARVALAPLSSRIGAETTKVVSLSNPDERVILSPSEMVLLPSEVRKILHRVCIIGLPTNDGPTRVFTFRMSAIDQFDDASIIYSIHSPQSRCDLPQELLDAIKNGAAEAVKMVQTSSSPSDVNIVGVKLTNSAGKEMAPTLSEPRRSFEHTKDLVISIRAAFSRLVLSFVDSAPSEIAVATFTNVNTIASWDTLRVINSTVYITLSSLQVDNMVPNAPFPVALCPFDESRSLGESESENTSKKAMPLLVIGLSVEPKHSSGIVCLKSATIAPRNLSVKFDLAFIVRLQKFALDLQSHFSAKPSVGSDQTMELPDIMGRVAYLEAIAMSGASRQKYHFGSLTILPFNIKLSVAPARALSPAQATLEGREASELHYAVRKGDLLINKGEVGVLGVKIGSTNKTPLMVVRGMFKSFVVDGLLRLDGASLIFAGVSLRNHTASSQQLSTALGAHYLLSLRKNLPSLVGSMAAFGNPLGLVRGLGEGVGDFVLEPVRGFQRSVQEMDASYLMDGVARGTISLARHTVGGFADSAAMLAETFSKNMTVLTLDRRYAQKRDRGDVLRESDDLNVASGLGSGVQKLVLGFLDGVTGVVRAPIRGAEKKGLEGFAKGIGKGLLGLLVKPMIGISDGFTDVMIGVKGTVEGNTTTQLSQVRPRRALYGRDKAIRNYVFADAAASALMLLTRLEGEHYLGHCDMGDRVALLSVRQLVILGRQGNELLVLKFKHVESVKVRNVDLANGGKGFGIIVLLNTPRKNGSEVEVIICSQKNLAESLCSQIEHGRQLAVAERRYQI